MALSERDRTGLVSLAAWGAVGGAFIAPIFGWGVAQPAVQIATALGVAILLSIQQVAENLKSLRHDVGRNRDEVLKVLKVLDYRVMRIAQMAEEAGEAAGLICVRTWPEVEAALQAQGFGKPRFLDMELSEMMWHGPCPVTGAGPDCARFGPGDDLMFVRKLAGEWEGSILATCAHCGDIDGGGLDDAAWREHLEALCGPRLNRAAPLER